MASILILGVKVPFTKGGQEYLVRTLRAELELRGHRVDTVELPLSMFPKESLLSQAAVWRSLDLSQFGGDQVDLVIGTKFPSYFVQHARKSLWLVHQHRAIYDLYGTRYSDFSDDPRDEVLRRMLQEADTRAIAECAYVSGISQNVITRLKNFNGIDGVVHYPPISNGEPYRCDAYEDFILSVGRLCSIKRVDLMLKALPIVHNFIKLKIVGTADEPGVMDYFKNEIDKHHLWDRVEFLGAVDEAQKQDLFARALAVYYAPYNEDYGYVTLEAMASAKPVITAHDSGGVLEFVRHEKNGLVLEPTTDSIGHGVNRLVEDRDFARALGQRGKQDITATGLLDGGWDAIISGLLSPLSSTSNSTMRQAVGT